jgi:hypothetical protein
VASLTCPVIVAAPETSSELPRNQATFASIRSARAKPLEGTGFGSTGYRTPAGDIQGAGTRRRTAKLSTPPARWIKVTPLSLQAPRRALVGVMVLQWAVGGWGQYLQLRVTRV